MSFKTNRPKVISILVVLCLGAGPFGQARSSLGQETQAAKPSDSESAGPQSADQKRIEGLSKLLTNSRWTGQFTTIDQQGAVGDSAKETYEITKAEKLPEGNLWLLTTRIKYGKRDVTVPLPINIAWTGETPVITVDKLLIPALGTFDARVLIRDGKYAGTWTHNEHGGHLFGKIGKMDPAKK